MNQPAATAIFVVTIAISLLGMYRMPQVIERSLFRPFWFLRGARYETLFTSGFVHADLGHLLFNMVTFFFFAFPMERHIGTWRFVLLYAVGLVLSHSCTYFKHESDRDYASLGASGAISGVLFAFIVFPDHDPDRLPDSVADSGGAVCRRLRRLLVVRRRSRHGAASTTTRISAER
ncbi:MAG: rhomboid family intramembrane serine protease [Woeseiaceae bacterium]|nr:rhomboid family intramembrane serine protease [Woeseiaceae bacterium]